MPGRSKHPAPTALHSLAAATYAVAMLAAVCSTGCRRETNGGRVRPTPATSAASTRPVPATVPADPYGAYAARISPVIDAVEAFQTTWRSVGFAAPDAGWARVADASAGVASATRTWRDSLSDVERDYGSARRVTVMASNVDSAVRLATIGRRDAVVTTGETRPFQRAVGRSNVDREFDLARGSYRLAEEDLTAIRRSIDSRDGQPDPTGGQDPR
ncbi:MAG: hypothetical protein JWO31_416 [Phycisphaerales bacterium]|nr:hypothetical protein [Phycisphaerales bacterium]